MTDPSRSEEVPPGGVVALPGDLHDWPMAVLDREGRILGDGQVPETLRMPVLAGRIRLITPAWEGGGPPLPESGYYAEGAMFTERLDPGAAGPIEVGVIEGGSTLELRSGRKAEPRLYEIHRGGRTYFGWAVWIGGERHCTHFEDVTGSGGQPDAIVLRCALPHDRSGIVWVNLHIGIRMTGLRIDARPGEKAMAEEFRTPVEGGYEATADALPTGTGLVWLEDAGGRARPPIRLPAYQP